MDKEDKRQCAIWALVKCAAVAKQVRRLQALVHEMEQAAFDHSEPDSEQTLSANDAGDAAQELGFALSNFQKALRAVQEGS